MTGGPPVLSIGVVLGDSDPESMAWKRAINALSRQVQELRQGTSSPLHLNVVYHVDGRLAPNEFTGVRAGRFDKGARHLMVQAAVPRGQDEGRPALLNQLLCDAIDEAESFAINEGLASNLAGIRALVSRLR